MKSGRFFVFFFGLFLTVGYAQQLEVDVYDLKKELVHAQTDSNLADAYYKLADFYLNYAIDSVPYFIEKGMGFIQKEDENRKLKMLTVLGNYYERKSDFDQALTIYDQALQLADRQQDAAYYTTLQNNTAMIYIRQGRYETANKLLLEVLRTEEERGNRKGIAQAYNNIGVIHYYLENFEKAASFFKRALILQEETGETTEIIQAINNLGAIYDHLDEHDKALALYEEALQYNKTSGDKRELGINLHNMAVSHFKLGNLQASRSYYEQALAVRQEIGDQGAIALGHYNYAELLRAEKQYDEARYYYGLALNTAKKADLKKIKEQVYGAMAELAKSENKFEEANAYLYDFVAIRDSILNKEKNESIAQAEAKYEVEKKEKQLQEQKADMAQQELRLERKNRVLYLLGLLVLLIGISAFFLYRFQKLKNQRLEKEAELKEALHKEESDNILKEERIRISRDLHDNIGSQLTFLISSIDNLKFHLKRKSPDVDSKLDQLGQFTRNTINELRTTVWAMNKKVILFSDLRDRFSNYFENAPFSEDGVQLAFSYDKGLDPNRAYSAFEAIHLYRILQEAISNALKHADATLIEVRVAQQDEGMLIEVKDNGIGFDMENASGGNGIINMKHRVSQIGGHLQIESQRGKGTLCKIMI